MWASVGIDGGLDGAVVAVSEQLKLIDWFDMPVIEERKKTRVKSGPNMGKPSWSVKRRFDVSGFWNQLRDMVRGLQDEGNQVMVFLEKARPMPKQGLASTFQTGRGFGLGEMAMAALEVPCAVVEPTMWQKVAHKGCPGKDPKSRSFSQSSRLFPGLPLKKPNGKKLTLDGRADASLIAYYGVTTLPTTSPVELSKPKRTPLKRK